MRILISILKYLGLLYLLIVSILFFVPKTNLYYLLEESILLPYQVKVINESFDDNGLGADISNLEIYYDGIFVSNIKDISLISLLIYSGVSIKDVKVDQMLKNLSFVDLKEVQLSHSILSPLKIAIEITGDAGEATGYLDIVDRGLHLVFKPNRKSRDYQPLLKYFKNKNGEYVYERNF